MKKGKRNIGKIVLTLCNIVLMLGLVFFTVQYSGHMRATQEELMRENFCNTVDTMKQISVRYLSGELSAANSWAAYIEQENMTMDEAMDYIRSVSDSTNCEAHFVDMDTFEAWSTNTVNGNNTVAIYHDYSVAGKTNTEEYIATLRRMFNGEKCVLGKYKINESQRVVISVGLPVHLRTENGSIKDYLLLRAVPVERFKELWLFPVNYASAEIGLIALNGDYVIPSYSMRAENFLEFVRAYSFADDYNGADAMLAQLKEQQNGLMELNNSRGEPCFWYYSRLDEFEGLDILGYIPATALTAESENTGIVFFVAGVLLVLAIIDGAYVMSINRRLRIAAQIAEKASQAKTQFLSTMSHDIRTPLNAVLGMTELAQSQVDNPDYIRECLRKISLSGRHLLTLVNDILEISRVESGQTSVTPTAFDVQELVSNLESITRSQAVGHGLEFEVVIGNLPKPYLFGDQLRLTQVYLNLLTNAVKYSNPGGSVRLELWEELLTENDAGSDVMLVCVVEDTGVGMSEEFQKTMYDSFTRVADSRTEQVQGTGLGLAIVRRMVDLMDGSIDCVSREGVGTTFTVRIPLLEAPAAAVQTESDGNQEQLSDLSGLRVLIAEDNDINWEIISEMLSGYGFQCTRAENGRVCVDMLTQAPENTYDLVLMDVQMPELNGRDATRALRAGSRKDLHSIPIIAMTADAFAEDVQMCLDAGMDAHVAKPVEIDKVLSTIRRLLARKEK